MESPQQQSQEKPSSTKAGSCESVTIAATDRATKSDSDKSNKKDPFTNFEFPKRPSKSRHGREVQLATNFHKMQIKKKDDFELSKYSINIEPEVAHNGKIVGQVIKQCKEQLNKQFQFYIAFHSNIYSQDLISDEIICKTTIDDADYTLTVRFSKYVTKDDPEAMTFLSIFFKQLMRSLSFEQIGRNCFNPKKAQRVNQLEVWPGFYSALNNFEMGPLLQIDLASKVCRTDSVLSEINTMLDKGYDQDKIDSELKGKSVVTSYSKAGKHTYKIEKIDFQKTVNDTFERKEGEISFKEYYHKQYGSNLRDENQPLLVSKNVKTGTEIYLVPEICEMTGLTDNHRNDFRLMKELSKILHKSAYDRKQEIDLLIREFQKQEKSRKLMENWKIGIESRPVEMKGQVIKSGNIIMGDKNNSFPADCNPNDFGRKTQNKMFRNTRKLNEKWLIVCVQSTMKDANILKRELEQALDQMRFQSKEPELFKLDGDDRDRNYQKWQDQLQRRINNKIEFVVFVLPGRKKSGKFYSEIKKMMTTQMPVPNQVVLGSTISAGRNLKSIVSKIALQINAKGNGTPWALDRMPLMDCPCSIIGYEMTKLSGGRQLLAICATHDQKGTKYFSKVVILESGELGQKFQNAFKECFKQFQKVNNSGSDRKVQLQKIIILRNGCGEGQMKVVREFEVEQIKIALESIDEIAKAKFSVVLVNKKVKTKLVCSEGGRLNNPLPGTVMDHGITKKDRFEFYLISVNCRQGVPTPTHYSVIYDSIGMKSEQIQELMYKLCYLYYNCSGAVKIPAPLKYAERLAQVTSEKNGFIPHRHYDTIQGLYFI